MNRGDFLLVDYVGRIAASNQMFDTTVEAVAKKEEAYQKGNDYKPALVILGRGMIVKGVEEALEKMGGEGEEATLKLPPEKAFGARSAEFVRTMPMSVFTKTRIEPAPGMFIDIGGMAAKIQSVSGGRVRVDLNHPLAGRDLIYWVKIVRIITAPLEKVEALLRHLGLKARASLDSGKLSLKAEKEPGEKARQLLEKEIRELVPEVASVVFLSDAEPGKQ